MPSLIQQYLAKYPIDGSTQAERRIRRFNQLDPSGNKGTYTPWILSQYLNNHGCFLDEDKVSNTLFSFNELKKKNLIPKGYDFNIQSIDSLFAFTESLNGTKSKKNDYEESMKLGKKLYDDGKHTVIRIRKSDDIVKFLGLRKITSWCIKRKDEAIKYAPVYFITENKKTVGVWSEEDCELSNRKNDTDTWEEKYRDNLVKILKTANPKLSIETHKEKALKDEFCMENYILQHLKSPFPEGEPFISRNSRLSFLYAKHVLKGPFPLGENAISKTPAFSCEYAMTIINKRFLKGEYGILVNLSWDWCGHDRKSYIKRFKISRKEIKEIEKHGKQELLAGRALGTEVTERIKALRRVYLSFGRKSLSY